MRKEADASAAASPIIAQLRAVPADQERGVQDVTLIVTAACSTCSAHSSCTSWGPSSDTGTPSVPYAIDLILNAQIPALMHMPLAAQTPNLNAAYDMFHHSTVVSCSRLVKV